MTRKQKAGIVFGVLALAGGTYYLLTKNKGQEQEKEFVQDPKVKAMIEAEKKAGEFTRVVNGTPQNFKITSTGQVVNKDTGELTALVGHKKPGQA